MYLKTSTLHDLFESTLFDQDLPRALADFANDIASPSIAPKVSSRDSIDAISDVPI
jgi:hypothetical protein